MRQQKRSRIPTMMRPGEGRSPRIPKGRSIFRRYDLLSSATAGRPRKNRIRPPRIPRMPVTRKKLPQMM